MSVYLLGEEDLAHIAIAFCAKFWPLDDVLAHLEVLSYANCMAFVDRYARHPDWIEGTEPVTKAEIRRAMVIVAPELGAWLEPGASAAPSGNDFVYRCKDRTDMANARKTMASLLYNCTPEWPLPYLSYEQLETTLEMTASFLRELDV